MPKFSPERPRRGLFAQVSMLSIFLVLVTVGPCAFLFIWHHRKADREALENQVVKLAESIKKSGEQQIEESEKALANFCQSVQMSPGVEFIVVTGSLPEKGQESKIDIYASSDWRQESKQESPWFPASRSTPAPMSVPVEGTDPWTGDPVMMCSVDITAPGSVLGRVHVGVSMKEYVHGYSAAVRNTITMTAISALLGVGGAFFLARRIALPLLGLRDMAEDIAGGDRRRRDIDSRCAEVQHLANHMNWMAEKLEEDATLIQKNQLQLEETNGDLRERVANEHLLGQISGKFLHAEHSAPDVIFISALEHIARRLEIDGASIFLHDTADQSTLVRMWEWHRSGAPVCHVERVPINGFPWAAALASRTPVVVIEDSAELPEEAAAERQNLERLSIRSATAALLGAGEKAAGYLFLRKHSAPRVWTERERQFIHLVAGIFSNAIARREAALERERLHAQLLQSQKMEAVGKLSGGIAHDFNNMLVPIVGYSDSILSNSPENAPWVHEIREIKRSAESAASLTRQLLSFSRKQIISRKEIDLNSLIGQLQHMLRRLLGENIDLQTDLDPEVWSIAADPSQVEQCLMNLTVNAKAAMPQGGSIRVTSEMIDTEDSRFTPPPLKKLQGLFVRLSVRDTGCGMDAATIARIFEPFFSTKGEEGTGLGLSVVYGVMEEHGGWITVESTPGKGTSFHLWFPALHEPTPRPVDTGLATAPPLAKGNGQRILLVEDEPGVLAFVSAALRQNGYKIVTADCGSAARQVFKAECDTIDLVMSDVVLPDTTGVQLLEEFFEARPDLKALLTSGYSEKNALVELVKKRGLFFLHKPYTLIQLLQSVHNALSGPSKKIVVA